MALSVSVNSGRIKYLDMTAGVLILFMLGMHFGIIDAGPSSVMNLFSIYMAWFFFKSGMFHREQQDSKYFAKKLAKKLLIPFLIFTLLGFILELSYKPMSIESVRGLAAQLITMGFAWCNAPLWFIFALFLTRMVTAKFNGRYWALWVIFFTLAAFFHHQLFTERFQYIGNVSLAIVYYIIGYKMRTWHQNNYIAISCFILYVIVFYFMPTFLDIRSNATSYGCYAIAISIVIPGIIAFNALMNKIKIPFIDGLLIWIGENAIGYVLIHWPIMLLLRQLPPPSIQWIGEGFSALTAWLVAILTFSISTFFIVLINRNHKLHWIIGK